MHAAAPNRTPPNIPNHEMVRPIGRGAYGEIWLARSLTGTWRAVKIVERETFGSEKAFQREFEGMARFEPISRGHEGFVDILHVGRDEAGGFFYYVMELADDHLDGSQVEPEKYAPKTIKSELNRRSRLFVDESVSIGISLTQALAALHRQGLVHRDIKPANIIFVGGKPKIADIGLVASHGQQSFVGTEGYVPPEGPGTVQADLYSLGKVLYEVAMGKDRLDFPELNSRLADLPDKNGLLRLNDVLLRACANDPAERYISAEEMHEDLARLHAGKPLARRGRGRWRILAAATGVLAIGGASVFYSAHPAAQGDVRIETDPPGAMIVFEGTMKRSPALFNRSRAGEKTAHVMFSGFEPADIRFQVEPNATAAPPLVKLTRSRGSLHVDSRPPGATFELRDGETVVGRGVGPKDFTNLPAGSYDVIARMEDRELSGKIEIKRNETTVHLANFPTGKLAVTTKPVGAEIWIDGKSRGAAPFDMTLPPGKHEVLAKYRTWPDQHLSIDVDAEKPNQAQLEFVPGSVKIISSPAGAQIFQNGVEVGRTPKFLEDIEPGEVHYELRLPGYQPTEKSGVVKPGEQVFLDAVFQRRAGPRPNEPWENSLGMKFVPVGDVLMGIWPVRVQDFDAFCQATGRARPVPDFPQTAAHPVVKVNWNDATAFCEWLTSWELKGERLADGQKYRLPKDAEWSRAAGLPDEGGTTPEERDGKVKEYAWGKQWPPPAGAGNFADSTLRRSGAATIAGYTDGFPQTSPVGTFAANAIGLYDISGNVWQWCQELYKPGARWGVLRGGSWANASQAELRSSYRNVVDRIDRDVIFGFRVVLELEPSSN